MKKIITYKVLLLKYFENLIYLLLYKKKKFFVFLIVIFFFFQMESLSKFFYKTNYKMISLVNITVNKVMKPIAEKCSPYIIFF